MLHKKFRTLLFLAKEQVATGMMSVAFWETFAARLDELTDQLEIWENSAAVGENEQLQELPENVVRLSSVREQRGQRIVPRPTDGGAA